MTTKKRIKKIPPTEPVITVENKMISGIPVKLVTSNFIGDTWTVKCPYCHDTYVVSFSKNANMYTGRACGWPMVRRIPFGTAQEDLCAHYYSHEESLTDDGHKQVTIQFRDLDKKLLTYKTVCPFCNSETLIFVQQYPTKYNKPGKVMGCRAEPYCGHVKLSVGHDYELILADYAHSHKVKFEKHETAEAGVVLVEELGRE